jgi:hypothetical protein
MEVEMPPIICPTCGDSNHLIAIYAHIAAGNAIHEFVVPIPTGTPMPRPCPTDGVMCNAGLVYCPVHNWQQ